MNFYQIILFPFSLLYQFILRLRNFLYDKGVFGVTTFDLPTISVGNLAFGGTGKTPHIEYLIRLLRPFYKPAVLSRGYKRKTVGYIFATPGASSETIGDEPFQIYDKFKDIGVGVAENRVLGLPNLLFDAPATELVLLDDAFQHRAIKPGLNILLTDYNKRFTSDYLAPAGTLREYASAYHRASMIIVTKCPTMLTTSDRKNIIAEINPDPTQQVFFSYLKFGELFGVYNNQVYTNNENALIFSGIANPVSFTTELQSRFKEIKFKHFSDHHTYTEKDVEDLLDQFKQIPGSEKIIVTTEKDRTKLLKSELKILLQNIPICYMPVEVEFFDEDKTRFDTLILDYVKNNLSAE